VSVSIKGAILKQDTWVQVTEYEQSCTGFLVWPPLP
jgi:hypothetical protein